MYYVGGPNWGSVDEAGSPAYNLCLGYAFWYMANPELPEPTEVCNLLDEFGSSQAISIMMQIHYT